MIVNGILTSKNSNIGSVKKSELEGKKLVLRMIFVHIL